MSADALTTKSLNDGTGWPSAAAALSRLRRSTASSMSTSMLRTNSGAVAFDSAIRRATVCCRRERSCVVVSPLPVCASPDTTAGGGAARSSRSGSGAAGASAGAAAWGAPPFDAASTSALTIRPPGPVPWSWPSSSPSSRAIRRATGDAFTRPFSPSLGSGASSEGASSAGSSRFWGGSASAVAVAAGSLVPPSSSAPSSRSCSAGAAPLLSPADPPPICAIVSPTASVSPSWATIFSAPSWSAS